MAPEATSAAALRLEGVNAFYGDSHVLRDVSFSLGRGRVLALLGRNGAGKTTCMSAIMGFLRPRRGTIRLYGEQVSGLAPDVIARKGICLVPQGRRMFRTLTVRENLMVAAQPRKDGGGAGWSIDRVFQLFPRLAERHGQVAGSLSGGEQQMLAIGRALMARPRLLLLDEPSLGLAPILVHTILTAIDEISREGTTILLVEQNAKAALMHSHRGYVLETGAIVMEGPSEQLAADPRVKEAYLGEK